MLFDSGTFDLSMTLSWLLGYAHISTQDINIQLIPNPKAEG